jgi:hypothetical protein
MYCQHDNYPSTCRICANARNATRYCPVCDQNTNHLAINCPFLNRAPRCRARDCTISHAKHYCNVCGDKDSTHRSRNCPRAHNASVILPRACRVFGCNDCKHGRTHYCSVCKNTDSDHFARHCPQAFAPQPRINYVRYQQPIAPIVHAQTHPMMMLPNGHSPQMMMMLPDGRFIMYRN